MEELLRIPEIHKLCLAVAAVGLCASIAAAGPTASKYKPNIGDFKIGVQSYSFRGHTFEEAVQKSRSFGLTYIEGYPGQRLSASMPDVSFGPGASPEALALAKKVLKNNGVKLYNFGVVGLPNNEAECRKVFDFAKEMGIQVITSEPEDAAWPIVERLTNEYKIKVAIHNHPKPSHYYDPLFTRNVLKGLNANIGACPDVGHWTRSGFDAVKSLTLVNGRIHAVHLKDLSKTNGGYEDAVLGEGVINLPGVFEELKRQKFDGVIALEFESGQPDPTAQVDACIKYLRKLLGGK